MANNKYLSGLIGTWQTEDEDSRLIIEISEKHGKPHVSAFDRSDGEKFKVSKIRFAKGVLAYELYVPSTKYRTRNKLWLSSKNVLNQDSLSLKNGRE